MQLQSWALEMIKLFFLLFVFFKDFEIEDFLLLSTLFFWFKVFVCIVGLSELVDLFNSSINIRFNIVINVNFRSSFSLLSYSCK